MPIVSYILRSFGSTLIRFTNSKDIHTRFRLSLLRDIACRFRLDSPPSGDDIACRFILARNPSDSIVLSPLRAIAGPVRIGVGPGVGQPADTIGGRRY
jgi:hypothetical protein